MLLEERKTVLKSINDKKTMTNDKDESNNVVEPKKKTKWNTILQHTQQMNNSTIFVDAIKSLLNGDGTNVNESELEKKKNLTFLKIFGDKSDVIDLINLERKFVCCS